MHKSIIFIFLTFISSGLTNAAEWDYAKAACSDLAKNGESKIEREHWFYLMSKVNGMEAAIRLAYSKNKIDAALVPEFHDWKHTLAKSCNEVVEDLSNERGLDVLHNILYKNLTTG
ncbi:hypothetical protein ACM9HF_02270 [Colwellia sp. RE-S-Sl-9]